MFLLVSFPHSFGFGTEGNKRQTYTKRDPAHRSVTFIWLAAHGMTNYTHKSVITHYFLSVLVCKWLVDENLKEVNISSQMLRKWVTDWVEENKLGNITWFDLCSYTGVWSREHGSAVWWSGRTTCETNCHTILSIHRHFHRAVSPSWFSTGLGLHLPHVLHFNFNTSNLLIFIELWTIAIMSEQLKS